MATLVYDSLTDHSPLDGTNDAINGAEVDVNPQAIARILDGTTATDLATDAAVDFRFTSARVGIRAMDLDAAAGAIHYGLAIEWDPASGNMTDGTSGVGFRFLMPDDANTQTIYARCYCLMVDDAAASDDAEIVWEIANAGTLTVEILRYGSNGFIFNDDGTDLDYRFETDTNANALYIDSGLFGGVGAIGIGGVAVNTGYVLIDNPATTAVANTNFSKLRIDNTAATTVPAGTTSVVASIHVDEPNITATGTVTSAVTVYIEAAPTEGGTNNYALWVDSGVSAFGGNVVPDANDGAALGTTTLGFSDLHLATGGVINWANGEATITETDANTLTVGGADLLIANNLGVVIGHTAQITAAEIDELQIIGTASVDARVLLGLWSAGSAGPALDFLKSKNGTIGSFTVVAADDILGTIFWYGDDGFDYSTPGASISGQVDGTPGSNDMPGRLVFSTTADGAASVTERMRITSSGNVLIGTGALATTATDGFLYIPSCAGAPTGVPTSQTGRSPIIHDTTNNRIYLYDMVSAVWAYAALT